MTQLHTCSVFGRSIHTKSISDAYNRKQNRAVTRSMRSQCTDHVLCTTDRCGIEGIALNRISMRYDEDAIKETNYHRRFV